MDQTSNSNTLKVGTLNIRSLQNKLLPVHGLLFENDYDILILTETRLNCEPPQFQGYKVLTCQPTIQGGVLIKAKSYLTMKPLNTYSNSSVSI